MNPARLSHLNLEKAKSYATKANLEAAIAKENFTSTFPNKQLFYTIVRNESGRWTAIFFGDCQMVFASGFVCIAS